MATIFTPEDILPDGEDHTLAVNPFTGFRGTARKGTVAATLNNIALLNRLFLENPEQDQITTIKQAIVNLMPSLKAIGVFDLFDPIEWLNNPKQLGRVYVAILYLKNYPEEISAEILHKLQEIKQTIQNFHFQSELQTLCK